VRIEPGQHAVDGEFNELVVVRLLDIVGRTRSKISPNKLSCR